MTKEEYQEFKEDFLKGVSEFPGKEGSLKREGMSDKMIEDTLLSFYRSYASMYRLFEGNND